MIAMSTNSFGKESKLELTIGPNSLEHVAFTAPYKVIRPFHRDGFLQVMVANVSAGIMAGDHQTMDIQVKEGGKAEILSQSYEKIHQMDDGEAVRNGKIRLEKDSVLYYTPLPTLPFAGSAFTNNMSIELQDQSSQLFYSEILACGRAARGERFQYKSYCSHLRIKLADHLIYVDNQQLRPASESLSPEGFTQYEGCTHFGTYLLINFPMSKAELQEKLDYQASASNCVWGISTFGENHICLKALGTGSEALLELQNSIKKILLTARNAIPSN